MLTVKKHGNRRLGRLSAYGRTATSTSLNEIPPITAGHRTTYGALIVLVCLKRSSLRSHSEDFLQSLSTCENVLMKLKYKRYCLSGFRRILFRRCRLRGNKLQEMSKRFLCSL